MPLYETNAYKIYKSDRPNKKYVAYLPNYNLNRTKVVHFGDSRYEQYFDKIGVYHRLDHNDIERRKAYYRRHNKKPALYTAGWFSNHFLW